MPQHVIDAFLAVEDKEFYRHDGVNVRSLVRATLSNFASDSPQQGASTITMQVVKNDFLAGLERDGRYKLLQVHYALLLERENTKDEILERYLNTVFFGNNAYGIQAAAETYFGKTADQLTFIEAAFLAGLVRAPSTYDPVNSPERSRARFVQVLDRLVDDGSITQAEADDLEVNFPLPDRVRTIPERTNIRTYYTEALRDYLLNRSDILGATYEERYAKLFRGGLRIHTTLQPDQPVAGRAGPRRPARHGAGLRRGDRLARHADRCRCGRWSAVAASCPASARSTWPCRRARRVRASSSSCSPRRCRPAPSRTTSSTGRTCARSPCPDAEPFVIKEAVSRAPDTLAQMTWRSINCAYVRLAQIVGLNRMVDTVYRMAQSVYLYPGQPAGDRPGGADVLQPYVSFSTGANEMSPMDMAAGAQTIANGGLHHEPYYVEWIETADGQRTYTHSDAGTQVLDRPRRADRDRHPEGRAHLRHRAQLPARGRSSGGRQDRHPGRQHERLVRRLHARDHDGGVGRRPQRLHADGQRPRVRRRQRVARAGWSLPDADLEDVHGRRARRPAVQDWEAPPAPARPPARLYLPGNECLFKTVVSGGEVLGTVPPAAPPAGPAGLRQPPPPPPPAAAAGSA